MKLNFICCFILNTTKSPSLTKNSDGSIDEVGSKFSSPGNFSTPLSIRNDVK